MHCIVTTASLSDIVISAVRLGWIIYVRIISAHQMSSVSTGTFSGLLHLQSGLVLPVAILEKNQAQSVFSCTHPCLVQPDLPSI